MSLRTWAGGIALAALTILGLAMAAAGPEVVPAIGRGQDRGWLSGAYGDGLGIDGDVYIWLERSALLAYCVVVACAGALGRRLLWSAIALLVVAFAVAPPLLSLDVFSYLSYARLELGGLNPYEHAPDSAPLDHVFEYLGDNRDVVSVYGPLFTILTLPVAKLLSLQSEVYALKALAAASVLATAWIAARLAAARGTEPRFAAALVALNPLVLVHVVGGGHNDALMAALMTAGIAAVALGAERAGGAGLIVAAGVKAAALLAVPFALAGAAARRRQHLGAGVLAALAAVLLLGLLVFGSGVFEALEVAGGNQDLDSRASLPVALADWLGLGLDGVKAVGLVLFALAVAGLLARVARGADWIRAAGWAFLGLLLASSYVTPWYVIWVLPLAAVSRDRSLIAASVLLSAFLLRNQVPGLGS